MYAYEKAVLKTYGQTEAFIKITEKAIIKGAFASYYSRRPAKDLAEEILKMKFRLDDLVELKNAIDSALSKIKPCYAYLLGVKYGAGKLGVGQSVERTAGYYRNVAYALLKFAQEMKRLGFTDEKYQSFAKNNEYFKSAYQSTLKFEEAVKRCGNLKVKGGKTLKGVKPKLKA